MSPIEESLKRGSFIRAFTSGGGLLVFRLEKYYDNDEEPLLIGYSEHPSASQALQTLISTYDTYFEYNKIKRPYETKYLTGSDNPTTDLDRLLSNGQSFRIDYINGMFVCQM